MISLETIRAHAEQAPHRAAVIEGDSVFDWARVRSAVEAVHAWLTHHLDPDMDHRAIILAPNTCDHIVMAAALAAAGIAWVGIDPSRDAQTVAEQVAMVRPTLLVVDTSLPAASAITADLLAPGATAIDLASAPGRPSGAGGSGGFATGVTPLADLTAWRATARPWSPRPFASLGFTSGTTGTPKLFTRRSRSQSQREDLLRSSGFGAGDRYLLTVPLAHASGHVWTGASLSLGGTVVLGGPDEQDCLRLVDRHRIRATFMVPPLLDRFVRAAADHPAGRPDTLRLLLTGGRHVSPRTIRRTHELLGPVLHLYYATTETGINTLAGPTDLLARPHSAGAPLPGAALRVVDPHSHADLPQGRTGQLAVSGPVVMDGYVGMATPWLHREDRAYVLTSDLAYLDDAGRLFVTGRMNGQDPSASLNVVHLEGELKEDPAVADACVSWQPDQDGARPVVAVELAADADTTRALPALHRRLAAMVPDAAVPIVVVPRIVYNTAGKVDVRRMRHLVDLHHSDQLAPAGADPGFGGRERP